MTPYNPEDWLDILGLVIAGVFIVAAAALPAWLSHRRQNKRLGAIEEQVVNNHGDDPDKNLRTQIDRVETAVEEGFRYVRHEFSGLREELRQERRERSQDDDDLAARVAALEKSRYHPEPFG